ncbi:SMI1/KNR4 family protein [Saccharopolyspora elongata]|uniref:SMI1/KNR4 family protein n=1 Tax=Saccharopolyspora elongata TaxID=2530387 RepID=A0A4R4YCF1_9PSEU|nr:SMI1/KNR4 family protein [Saccharopolyspora elongata]TDD42301.1 SMI1/KNR4 family protein [Saccharopolyspora elongata]
MDDLHEGGRGSSPAPLKTPQEWRGYLREYSELRVRTDNEPDRGGVTAEQGAAGWLGYEPATEQAVAAAEHRLAVRFPPSFRGFLLASDGWPGVGGWIEELYSCDRLAWFRDTDEGGTSIDVAEDFFGDWDSLPEDDSVRNPVTIFERSLLVAGGQDYWLLDPAEPGADGEWIAWRYEPSQGEVKRFANFAELFHFCRNEGNAVVTPSPTTDHIAAHSGELGSMAPALGSPLGRRIGSGDEAVPPDADAGKQQLTEDESAD